MKNLYDYLVTNNPPENVYTFSSKKLFWDWRQEIKQNKIVSLKAAILIFVGFDETVLYIGSTELVKSYVKMLKGVVSQNHIKTVYVIIEQPLNLLTKTNKYRQLFLSKKNVYIGNGKFIAQEDENCLIIPIKRKPIIEWILANPSASFDEFKCVFRNSFYVISSLCRVFSCENHNLSELQHALKNNKKIIRYI